MAKAERVRLATDERRAQLLELGRRLFNERAYDEISIDDIASAAGISKGLLYHYFPSKRDFYVEIVRASARELVERTEPSRDLPPDEKLVRSLDAYLDYVQSNARAYAGLMRGGIGVDPEVSAIVEGTRRELIERLAREGLRLKELRPSVRIALRGWIGFVEAVSLDWLDQGDVDRETLRATLASALAHALTTAQQLDPKSGLGS